jgi:hypothetical protein
MIRAILLAACLLAFPPPAHADNNPFSGARSITVVMVRDTLNSRRDLSVRSKSTKKVKRPFRLRCTLDGKPMAEWQGHRVKLDGEWVDVPADAAGPMMVLLWAGGARCR